MRRAEELREQREDLLDELSRHDDQVVLVEGRRDREALEERGFAHVMTINRNGGLHETAKDACEETESEQKILLLTDFDPEGDRLEKKLRDQLHGLGCRTDDNGRRRLRRHFLENRLTTIQGLSRLEKRHLMEG